MTDKIHIIPSHKLDKARWDNCINSSLNGQVYATSVYLDAMADHWDAMVLNDYEYVMPLPWRKKYFIHYVYPPAFVQQLGIFSFNAISSQVTELFIQAIPKKYRYCVLHFNYANPVSGYNATARKNYLLDMTAEYATLHQGYSRSAIRNITKANNAGIVVKENISPGDIIALHRARFNDGIGAIEDDYKKFSVLCNALVNAGQCYTAGAYDGETLIAGSIYFIYKNRLTFILNGNTKQSLNCGATHLLKDHTINKFAGQGLVLDFEGSDFENFARFYEQFGAKEAEHYSTVVINRLPRLLRFLKR